MENTIKIDYIELAEQKELLLTLKNKLDNILIAENIMLYSSGESSDVIDNTFQKLHQIKHNVQVSIDYTITLMESIQQDFTGLENTFIKLFER